MKEFIKGDMLDTFVTMQKEFEYENSGYTVQSIVKKIMSFLFFGGIAYRVFFS